MKKLLEWEEISAVAMAVHNTHLPCRGRRERAPWIVYVQTGAGHWLW
jgi:hypothetical protein